MKRELKHEDLRTARIEMHDIAEPIPMKRELKLYAFGGVRCKVVQNCRAYPDEKGIETYSLKEADLAARGSRLQSLSR